MSGPMMFPKYNMDSTKPKEEERPPVEVIEVVEVSEVSSVVVVVVADVTSAVYAKIIARYTANPPESPCTPDANTM